MKNDEEFAIDHDILLYGDISILVKRNDDSR